jgi:hypothetical protein
MGAVRTFVEQKAFSANDNATHPICVSSFGGCTRQNGHPDCGARSFFPKFSSPCNPIPGPQRNQRNEWLGPEPHQPAPVWFVSSRSLTP